MGAKSGEGLRRMEARSGRADDEDSDRDQVDADVLVVPSSNFSAMMVDRSVSRSADLDL